MKKILSFLLAFILSFFVSLANAFVPQKNVLLQYVDPMIGAGGHGHVFIGASVPWGAVQVGPNQIPKGWDWSSGYHYSDSLIIGFSQLHLSGTGCSDLGDIMLMPYTGKLYHSPRNQSGSEKGYGALFSHTNEKVEPGYYNVNLDNGVKVYLTSTERVGLHKYVFPKNGTPRVAVDLSQGIGDDRPVKTYLIKKDDYTLLGYRLSTGWAVDQRCFFAIKTSKPIKELQLFDGSKFEGNASLTAQRVKGILTFADNINGVEIKVGISSVSSEGALDNIEKEIPYWNFDKVLQIARDKWEKALEKIIIQTKDETKKKIFYTAMYHSMIHPSLFNDYDKSYYGTDKKIYNTPSFDNYTILSLWDTYRQLHPLMTIIAPDKVADFINTFINIHKQQGRLPMWHLVGNETNTMVGNPAIPVVADAIMKGFKGFDVNEAYQAMTVTANFRREGIGYLLDMGFIPCDKENESVAKAMEYAIADMSIAEVAKKLGKKNDYEYYLKRGKAYQRYYDKSVGFMRGILSNGKFRNDFDPFKSVHRQNDYTEGNAWQYLWLAPQDPYGLINLLGGKEKFTKKLDSLFIVHGDMGGEASPDISGLIGMYAHGNEPSHHIVYMYGFAGQQWKTAEKVRTITHDFYTAKPDGIIGNDDCGQMSAWYICSTLGFYQVNPSNGVFVFGSPHFDKATINVGDGKKFQIDAKNISDANIYIQSVKLNGKNYPYSYIEYKDLMKGGKLEFMMGNKPNKSFGAKQNIPN